MSLPKTEQTPDDPNHLPPARRRRAKRLIVPMTSSGRERFLAEIARQLSPTFDFFLFSLIAASTISIGFLLDSPGLLILGVLFAPTMTPIIGLSLGTVTGSTGFFTRSLLGIGIFSVFGLLIGTLVGYLARLLHMVDLTLISLHARLSWTNILVLAIGAVLTTLSLVRTKRRGAIASVALSYEILLPLAVAGFGLGSGIPYLWPDGLVVFAIHLACAALFGTITFFLLGFRPLTLFGYTIGGVTLLLGAIIITGLSGAGAAFLGNIAIPTPIPSSTPTLTSTPSPTMSLTPTITPIPPTATLTPTHTQTFTPTATETPFPSPTPVYALVNADEFGGAYIRSAPEINNPNTIITSILNETLVQVLSAKPEIVDDLSWYNVRLPDGTEGWMLQSVLLLATPAPNW